MTTDMADKPKVVLVNPKDGKELTIDMTEKEAVEIVSKLKSEFAQSIAKQASEGRRLSQAQAYWLYKLAQDNRPEPERPPVPLVSDLQDFVRKAGEVYFEKCIITSKFDCAEVRRGHIKWGRIVGNQFFPSPKCPTDVIVFIIMLGANPLQAAQNEGRRTGRCCICGLTLTNPESIELGIGPICRAKF